MKFLKDVLIFIFLMCFAFGVIILIEGDKFKFDYVINDPEFKVTHVDKTDSVLKLVDEKILEVNNMKKTQETIIDSLKDKIAVKDEKSKINKAELEKLKDELSNAKLEKPTVLHKALAKSDTVQIEVIKYDTVTVTVANLVVVHDTVIPVKKAKLKKLKRILSN